MMGNAFPGDSFIPQRETREMTGNGGKRREMGVSRLSKYPRDTALRCPLPQKPRPTGIFGLDGFSFIIFFHMKKIKRRFPLSEKKKKPCHYFSEKQRLSGNASFPAKYITASEAPSDGPQKPMNIGKCLFPAVSRRFPLEMT